MGTEYYLICPEVKEKFALGKHLSSFSGIKNAIYGVEPDYLLCDTFRDFWLDAIDNNEDYLYPEMTWGEIIDDFYAIYSWCEDKKILIANDCMDGELEWLEWPETGSIYPEDEITMDTFQ